MRGGGGTQLPFSFTVTSLDLGASLADSLASLQDGQSFRLRCRRTQREHWVEVVLVGGFGLGGNFLGSWYILLIGVNGLIVRPELRRDLIQPERVWLASRDCWRQASISSGDALSVNSLSGIGIYGIYSWMR